MEKIYSSSNPVSVVTLAQTVFEIFEIACTDKWVLHSRPVSLALQMEAMCLVSIIVSTIVQSRTATIPPAV